ncbi:MAG: hypothetical protein J3K34DRAFT_408294 [Monoraphidium minutum]|nr:MAG: hypothetical protein J3K34DRAFT_408294 [Monoraphidium minutum]
MRSLRGGGASLAGGRSDLCTLRGARCRVVRHQPRIAFAWLLVPCTPTRIKPPGGWSLRGAGLIGSSAVGGLNRLQHACLMSAPTAMMTPCMHGRPIHGTHADLEHAACAVMRACMRGQWLWSTVARPTPATCQAADARAATRHRQHVASRVHFQG